MNNAFVLVCSYATVAHTANRHLNIVIINHQSCKWDGRNESAASAPNTKRTYNCNGATLADAIATAQRLSLRLQYYNLL